MESDPAGEREERSYLLVTQSVVTVNISSLPPAAAVQHFFVFPQSHTASHNVPMSQCHIGSSHSHHTALTRLHYANIIG